MNDDDDDDDSQQSLPNFHPLSLGLLADEIQKARKSFAECETRLVVAPVAQPAVPAGSRVSDCFGVCCSRAPPRSQIYREQEAKKLVEAVRLLLCHLLLHANVLSWRLLNTSSRKTVRRMPIIAG
jgi:hypothetical protein